MFSSDPIPLPHHCFKILLNLVNAKPGSDNVSNFTNNFKRQHWLLHEINILQNYYCYAKPKGNRTAL